MNQTESPRAVPAEAAAKICDDLRSNSLRRLHVVSALWCWGCATFTKGDAASMCGGVVACPQVVARYVRSMLASDL